MSEMTRNHSQWGGTTRRVERRRDVVEDSRAIQIDFSTGSDFSFFKSQGGIGSMPRLSDVAVEKWGISSIASEMERREGGCVERTHGHLPWTRERTTVNDARCHRGQNHRVERYEMPPRSLTMRHQDGFNANMPTHFECSTFNPYSFSRLDNRAPMRSDLNRPWNWWRNHLGLHEEINWTTQPPSDSARFKSSLDGKNRRLLGVVVEILREDRQVSIMNLSQSALGEGRSLGSVAEILPELARAYGWMTGHQMKTVAMIDSGVGYKTPWRGRGIRIKMEGKKCRGDPHLAFATVDEAEKFGIYGFATLAIVIQAHLHGPRNKLLRDLEKAIHSGRVEKLIIFTSEIPPLGGIDPYSLFGNKTTVKYWQIA